MNGKNRKKRKKKRDIFKIKKKKKKKTRKKGKMKRRKKHTFGWQKFLLLLAIYKYLLHLLLGWARTFLKGKTKKKRKKK